MPVDIKWPQKVTRYRIQCPFQRLLIAKHESQIDWSGHRIESGEALDRYLREVMLPGLKDCITPDHPKSHYCKSIHLERMLANPAPHINEARQIRQHKGDEAARHFLLGHINQHKKEHFEGWWRYLMEENPLYAQHPAFQYLVLRPVLEGSTAKDTRTPLPVDAEALAHLFERMRAGRVAPGTKLLSVLSEIMAFGAKAAGDGKRPSFGTDCRWVVVKRQDANAANRVAALSQGSGWCVASSEMADYYLGDSDFHLLVEGGRAKVALRLSKNQAVEVQGHGNQDPGPWWPRILLYCAARGTQITDHRRDAARSQAESIRQELIAAQRTTRRLGELLRAQPAKVHLVAMPEELDDASRLVVQEAWLACVRADPLCGGLLPGWMEADPAVKQATLEAWIALVRSDPQSYAAVPGALAQEPRILAALRVGWMELLRRDVTRWNQCPEFLQLEFRQDGGFIQTFKMGWMELLNRDFAYTTCPEFLQKDEEVIKALMIGWRTLLKRDVTQWNRCPEFLQQDEEVIHARKAAEIAWLRLQFPSRRSEWIKNHLERKVLDLQDIPDDLLSDDLRSQRESLLPTTTLPAYANASFRALIQEPRATLTIVKGWRHSPRMELAHCGQALTALRERPWNFSTLSPEQQDHLLIFEAAAEGWVKLLTQNPKLEQHLPPSLISHPKIKEQKESLIQAAQQALVKCCLDTVKKRPAIADEALKEMKLPANDKKIWKEITALRLKHWKRRVKEDWRRWGAMPESLRQHKDVLKLLRETLGPQIRQNPALWNDLPDSYHSDPALQRVHHYATRS